MSTEVFGDATRGDAWASVSADGRRTTRSSRPTRRGSSGRSTGSRCSKRRRSAASRWPSTRSRRRSDRCFAARPQAGRVAVAMSGGVDSAVALHRAGPNAIGVTLRLWQDPAAPDTERACCSPAAVSAARAACHFARAAARDARSARGVQGRDRRPVHAGVRARRDAESVHALQRCVSLRRARGIRDACRC